MMALVGLRLWHVKLAESMDDKVMDAIYDYVREKKCRRLRRTMRWKDVLAIWGRRSSEC